MNDTTTTPATPNELLSENHDLLYKLLAVIETHVNQLVERRVNDIMQSHATLALIDEKMEDRLREIAKELVDEHESDNDHATGDDVRDTVATEINEHDFSSSIKQAVYEILSDGDYATEERVEEMLAEHEADIDIEEKVKDVLRNI
jgi:hypothetical protein